MEEQQKEGKTGKPAQVKAKVLSTSLGLALAANLMLLPAAHGETAGTGGASSTSGDGKPTLVEWSNDTVKSYFDPNMDWNIPLPANVGDPAPGTTPLPSATPQANGGTSGSGGTNTVIVQNGGGFGWDDLLLYHLIFNRGGSYSSGSWTSGHTVYDTRTSQPYKPKTYDSTTFQNKPTANSAVKPKTSSSTGVFTSKGSKSSSSSKSSGSSSSSGKATTSGSSSSSGSTSSGKSSSSSSGKSSSSSSGSIGGKSSGFSSSSGS